MGDKRQDGTGPTPRATSGRLAQARGMHAEDAACAALLREGWTVLGRRLRTASGEIDIAAERGGLLALIEVKARPSLGDAAFALGPRQQARLLAAAAVVTAENPNWGAAGIRFDVILVDALGRVRRIVDAFRLE